MDTEKVVMPTATESKSDPKPEPKPTQTNEPMFGYHQDVKQKAVIVEEKFSYLVLGTKLLDFIQKQSSQKFIGSNGITIRFGLDGSTWDVKTKTMAFHRSFWENQKHCLETLAGSAMPSMIQHYAEIVQVLKEAVEACNKITSPEIPKDLFAGMETC